MSFFRELSKKLASDTLKIIEFKNIFIFEILGQENLPSAKIVSYLSDKKYKNIYFYDVTNSSTGNSDIKILQSSGLSCKRLQFF